MRAGTATQLLPLVSSRRAAVHIADRCQSRRQHSTFFGVTFNRQSARCFIVDTVFENPHPTQLASQSCETRFLPRLLCVKFKSERRAGNRSAGCRQEPFDVGKNPVQLILRSHMDFKITRHTVILGIDRKAGDRIQYLQRTNLENQLGVDFDSTYVCDSNPDRIDCAITDYKGATTKVDGASGLKRDLVLIVIRHVEGQSPPAHLDDDLKSEVCRDAGSRVTSVYPQMAGTFNQNPLNT